MHAEALWDSTHRYDQRMTDEPALSPEQVVLLTSPEAERLAHLSSLAHDLNDAKGTAELLRDELARTDDPNTRLVQALYTSAVVSYARAFNSGRRSKSISEFDFAALSPEALAAHRYILKVRDQHIAHQVLPFEEIKVGLALNADRTAVAGVAVLGVKRMTDNLAGVDSLIALIDVMLVQLNALLEAQHDTVLEFAETLDVATLQSLPPMRITIQAIDVPNTPPR